MYNKVPSISQMVICSVEGETTSGEMLDILFETLGRFCRGSEGVSTVQCLQRKSPTCYIVVLRDFALSQSLLRKSPIISRGLRISVLPMSSGNVAVVTVKGILPNVPFEAITSQLMPYGKIISIWNESYRKFPTVHTGNILVRIALETEIPPCIYVWGQRGNLYFNRRKKLCWRCGSSSHLLAQCNNITCSVCKRVGHFSYKCPYVKKNNNVKSWIPPTSYYYHNHNRFNQTKNTLGSEDSFRISNSYDETDHDIRTFSRTREDKSGKKRLFGSDEPKNSAQMDWVSEDSGIIEDNLKEIQQAFSELGISYLHHTNKKLKYDSKNNSLTSYF